MVTLESAAAGSQAEAPATGLAVEVAHLRKTYGTLVAVGDVSFTVAEGEIFGILGPNGAGKPPPSNALSGCGGGGDPGLVQAGFPGRAAPGSGRIHLVFAYLARRFFRWA